MNWTTPILMLILPPIAAFFIMRRHKIARAIFSFGWLIIMLVSCYPVVMAFNGIHANDKFYDLYSGDAWQVTNDSLHGLSGWEGVDISAGCGKPIRAPFTGIVTYNGLDNYNHVTGNIVYEQSTMLTITNGQYEVTLLHGDYDQNMTSITQGQVIGYEASNGWSTGCHSHVTVKNTQGQLVNYLDLVDLPVLTTWYNPELGGINCAAPCNMFADGTQVTGWYGESDVVSLACPAHWLGRHVNIAGFGTGKCKDRGGMIGYQWNDIYQQMVIHIDVLSREEIPCNYCLYEVWE